MKDRKLLIEPHYLGSIEYFSLLSQFDEVVLETSGHYLKQTYRNRACILTANGSRNLVVPVRAGNRTPLREVQIDYSQTWLRDHIRSIQAAYARAPYYDHLIHAFHQVWEARYRYLYELSLSMMTICLELLGLDIRISETRVYEDDPKKGTWDYREAISPKREFEDRRIYRPVGYIQNFGNKFVPNLSILDSLMCVGNEALGIVRQSAIPVQNKSDIRNVK